MLLSSVEAKPTKKVREKNYVKQKKSPIDKLTEEKPTLQL